MPRVFVAYHPSDSDELAYRMIRMLSDCGDMQTMGLDSSSPESGAFDSTWRSVASCDVLLALMNKTWLSSPNGISDPANRMRTDITVALHLDIPVVPVLLGDCPLPRITDVPFALAPLTRLIAIRVEADQFDSHAKCLVTHLQQGCRRSRAPRGHIFISYRRTDLQGQAQLLHKSLATHFGREHVLMDVDTLNPGEDFEKVLKDAISRCDVFLAVIGRSWLSVTDETGRRRLDAPNDYVRTEIAAAIRLGIRVVPVVFGGARLPYREDLPYDIAPLARMKEVVLADFSEPHIAKLIKNLENQTLTSDSTTLFDPGSKVLFSDREPSVPPAVAASPEERNLQESRDVIGGSPNRAELQRIAREIEDIASYAGYDHEGRVAKYTDLVLRFLREYGELFDPMKPYVMSKEDLAERDNSPTLDYSNAKVLILEAVKKKHLWNGDSEVRTTVDAELRRLEWACGILGDSGDLKILPLLDRMRNFDAYIYTWDVDYQREEKEEVHQRVRVAAEQAARKVLERIRRPKPRSCLEP